MDGDLQNDPDDIGRLLAKIDEGYDVVSGWRRSRKDPLSKRVPSRVAQTKIDQENVEAGSRDCPNRLGRGDRGNDLDSIPREEQ